MFKIIIIFFICFLLIGCATTKKTNPRAAYYNTQLAMLYLKQGNVEYAKNKMLLALRQDPDNPIILDAMGYFLERTGDSKLAEKYYLRALTLAPQNGAVQNNYGVYLCQRGSYRKSIKHFLIAANNIDYLHTKQAYKNASICALKIPDKKLAVLYLRKSNIY